MGVAMDDGSRGAAPAWPGTTMRLLDEGREDLAWLWAEATGQPSTRQRVLAFFAAAMGCDPASLEASLPEVLPQEVPDGAPVGR